MTGTRTPLTVRDVARVREAHAAGHPLPVIAASLGITERQAAGAAAGQTRGLPVPAEPRRPACMDDDEWQGWQAGNRLQNYQHQANSPCDDCITGFALAMRAEGRCDGIPLGVEDADPPLLPIRTWAPRRSLTGRERSLQNLRLGRAVSARNRHARTRQQGLRAQALERQGYTPTQIGYHMGVSASTVSKYLTRLQPERRRSVA